MAVKVQIEVVIDETGEVRLKTHGFKGDSCMTELKSMEKDLGPMKNTKKTSEFYEKAVTKNKVNSKAK